MKKIKSKINIRGMKKTTSHEKSYDTAFKLVNTIKHYQRKISDKNVIIYPSAWYGGFFEIMLRDRNNHNENCEINSDELIQVIEKHLPNDWKIHRENYTVVNNRPCTPTNIQFKFKGGK